MPARSFAFTAALADELARPLAEARSSVASPSGGIVFVSGALAYHAVRAAEQVRAAWRGVPACVVPSAGVLSERCEIEGTGAASGILWAGGRAVPVALASPEDKPTGALGEVLARAAGAPTRGATAVLFAQQESFGAEMLDGVRATAPKLHIFGGGTVGGAGVMITAEGALVAAPIVGLVLLGLAPPIVEATPACRLLSEFSPIDEASGGMVASVGGMPALDLLSSLTSQIGAKGATQPLVFAALADDRPDAEGRERYVVRPVRGIDPTRRAVLIGREARPGVRFAFGVRDAGAARAGLEAAARTVAQQALGAAPRFALYLSCAGRGQGLYGASDVESRILRQRFGDLPIAGMHSSFEIAPWGPGDARLALYTGVLALFRSPS